MKPYYADDQVTLWHGDCLDVMRNLPDASIDAVITDPPYGLEFMGREWDKFTDPDARFRDKTENDVASAHRLSNVRGGLPEAYRAGHPFQQWCTEWATECLRVLKPGGHMLAFGGTRTWHRLACAIEDAGFEVRDSIAWLYGSGFPKSLDVSKAIDRKRDDQADVLAVTARLADLADAAGISRADLDEHMGTSDMGGWWLSRLAHRAACPSVENWTRLRDLIPGAPALDAEVWRLNGRKGTPGEAWTQREVITERTMTQGGGTSLQIRTGELREVEANITAPATDDARTWQGWGTALKPAHEPIVVARKPLTGTVAANVLAHGTGAINVDACRVGPDVDTRRSKGTDPSKASAFPHSDDAWTPHLTHAGTESGGRWPPNVLLDPEAATELDRQSGTLTSGANPTRRGSDKFRDAYGDFTGQTECTPARGADSGGASRFFPIFRYEAKADASERPRHNGTAHPTVKPLDLMRWLVRLVTPPGGVILDPFAGSGTTGEACILEHKRAILIEREDDYLPLIVARLSKPLEIGLDLGMGA